MRLAFVDLLFSWPPHGGADVDAYWTLQGLQQAGHEVHLFGARDTASWERGNFEPDEMPFPCTRLDFAPRDVNRHCMPERFRAAVDAWRPDAVMLGDGFFLKPYVGEALAHYPMVARYYAYELTCHSDFRMFQCTANYLREPDRCRRCAVRAMGPEIKRWKMLSWTQEYVAARAFMPSYYELTLRFLKRCRSIIVYNRIQRELLTGFHENVHIVPGGVNVDEFAFSTKVPPHAGGRPRIILMTGRVEDPAKGFSTLSEAAERLAQTRSDFEVWVTHTDPGINRPWMKAIGWKTPTEMRALYGQADICVVASVWEEPFGMVAVEAMASGRPVCASRVGGLQDIVLDGETGFLFERGDSATLEEHLARLLDDRDLCERMGTAGRQRAEREYDWVGIVERYYPQILEELTR